jgi:hypothetical protein
MISIGSYEKGTSIAPVINTLSDSIFFFLLFTYGIFYYFFFISFYFVNIKKNLKILNFGSFAESIITPTILGVSISPTILISLGLFNILPISLNLFNVI